MKITFYFLNFRTCLSSRFWLARIFWPGPKWLGPPPPPQKKIMFCSGNNNTNFSDHVIIATHDTAKHQYFKHSGWIITHKPKMGLHKPKMGLTRIRSDSHLVWVCRPVLGLHMTIFHTIFYSAFSSKNTDRIVTILTAKIYRGFI